MKIRKTLNVKGTEITLLSKGGADYISLTDMISAFGDDTLIYSWMRNRNTLEFIGLWEQLHNPVFKGNEFVTFKLQAGLNNFNLTPQKWIKATGAIGLISKPGRYGGGTFAHRDIAFEFASWLSPEFKLYLIKEFQRLKEDENQRKSLDWDLKRSLAKINYRIHTDAIKEHLIPKLITSQQAHVIYASEADILNMALFGLTAKDWRAQNADKEGNIRDYAMVEQLVVLSNLESLNALWVEEKIAQPERLIKLNKIAISQMRSLLGSAEMKRLDVSD